MDKKVIYLIENFNKFPIHPIGIVLLEKTKTNLISTVDCVLLLMDYITLIDRIIGIN